MLYNDNEIYYTRCSKCGCYLDLDELCEDCDIRRNGDIYKTVTEGDEKNMYIGHTSNNFICIDDITGVPESLNKVIYNPRQSKEFNKKQLIDFCKDKEIEITKKQIDELLNSPIDTYIQTLHMYYMRKFKY